MLPAVAPAGDHDGVPAKLPEAEALALMLIARSESGEINCSGGYAVAGADGAG